ncbi:ChrR-like protein with cupin domain [Paenibacillus cellulosilyticus]|uniref:ChrR-like protein with cupin domain n=1 Tax=Paenibacillus cellulosilyticus TaxID=375489 RepID=A0A2V2YWN5_9BACL|nr:2,4'-dihydroxyacetophenone dioxygenase family protein [Paenibacillus cellulosilyticus]PWW06142.1 ChrR-like protein with cupin domain [Paenibacillus cellulosilyticus]QKS43089.1 2,4'-dihydroxyacetophenone dioxygenase family protein [Paenibacillus cellulosilyticus]
MTNIIDEAVIQLAERFQLPERVVNIEELPWVPFTDHESCYFKPLRFDLNTGTWIYLFRIKSNQVLGKHRHTGGSVIGYNIQGRWRYEDRSWVATPGTFVFEPPGDIHTLITEDEEVVTLFILSGALQYFDDDNQITSQDDIYTVLKKYRNYCTHHGIAIREDLIY